MGFGTEPTRPTRPGHLDRLGDHAITPLPGPHASGKSPRNETSARRGENQRKNLFAA